MYYYLSLGSNIEPEQNIKAMIVELVKQFGQIWLSPPFYSHPMDISSDLTFINSLVIVSSQLDPKKLKKELQAIEGKLGRDMSDPDKSLKDRTADIDILFQDTEFDSSKFKQITEPYLQDAVWLPDSLNLVPLEFNGLTFPKRPATVHYRTGAGDKIIIDEVADRLD